MDLTSIIVFLIIGAVAGWLAGVVMKGGGFGLLGDIVIGIIGAFIGGWLFGVLGISAEKRLRKLREQLEDKEKEIELLQRMISQLEEEVEKQKQAKATKAKARKGQVAESESAK